MTYTEAQSVKADAGSAMLGDGAIDIDGKKNNYSGLWTTADVAREIQVSTRTVANWRTSRKVPSLKIGRAVRFVPEHVLRALNAFEVKAIEPVRSRINKEGK